MGPKTDKGLAVQRPSYCDSIRRFRAPDKMTRRWPLRYLIRCRADDTLDHAWEVEDKDLANKQG